MNLRASANRAEGELDRPAADPETALVRTAVAAVRNGDREAFGRIVERYQRRLFGLVLMMVRNPEAAEEVAQDAFVRAFTRLDLYDNQRPFYPWLATIAVRLSQNWLVRHSRTTSREDAAVEPDGEAAATADPLADLIADEEDRRLWRSVAALPSGERTAVILYYRQDMTVKDIARALGVTTGTVKTLLFRGRGRLRRTVGTTPQASPDRS